MLKRIEGETDEEYKQRYKSYYRAMRKVNTERRAEAKRRVFKTKDSEVLKPKRANSARVDRPCALTLQELKIRVSGLVGILTQVRHECDEAMQQVRSRERDRGV